MANSFIDFNCFLLEKRFHSFNMDENDIPKIVLKRNFSKIFLISFILSNLDTANIDTGMNEI